MNIPTFFRAKLNKVDIKEAFLRTPTNDQVNGEDTHIIIKITKDRVPIWIRQDPESEPYVTDRGELHLQLDKYLYGLKQSPLKFQLYLASTLEAIGYKQSSFDECLYFKNDETGLSLISVHSDDLLQCTTSVKFEKEL